MNPLNYLPIVSYAHPALIESIRAKTTRWNGEPPHPDLVRALSQGATRILDYGGAFGTDWRSVTTGTF